MKGGWKYKLLKELCDTGAGGTPLKQHDEYYVGGTIPWLRSGEVCQKEIYKTELFITELGLNNSSARLFPVNTVLIAMYGATAGQVGILKIEATTNQAVCGILPNENFIPEFLYYFFLSYKDKLVAQAVGGAQPNISQIKIKNTLIPNIPLSEQQRIVEILDNAFAKIDAVKQNAERNLKNTQELFQSVLSHELLKKQGWISTKLENVCSLYQGLAINAKTKHLLIDKSSIPLLRIKDLKNNTEELYVKEEGYPPSSLVQKNDILYTRTGSLGLVFTGRYGVLHNNCFKIVPTKDIDRDYLIWFLQENRFKKRILSLAERAAQPDITHKLFKEQIIPYPSLSEQQQIVSKLDALSEKCKELEKNYQQTIDDCDDLKKAILAKAFNGEL